MKRRLVLWLAPLMAGVVILIASTHGGCASVRRTLVRVAAFDRVETRLLILGDNIYPRGLVREDDPLRKEMERRLDAQLEVATGSGATAYFTPGNHDWDAWGPDGWNAIRRQGDYIESRSGGRAEMLPDEGCPGPVVRDLGQRLRLILLDTQWWVHPYEKPRHPGSPCPTDSETEVLDALSFAIASAGERYVVVAGHHPLATGGLHGGYFGWSDHVFPLRARKSWLWIPLPGLGSLYPWARRRGVSDQDMAGALNRKMREALEGVFSRTPPFAYAAGHDHNLQVISGKDVKYLIVSGAGYYGHVSRAAWTKETLFAEEASGYMVLEIGLDGRPRLGAVTVDGQGKTHEPWSASLH